MQDTDSGLTRFRAVGPRARGPSTSADGYFNETPTNSLSHKQVLSGTFSLFIAVNEALRKGRCCIISGNTGF